MLKTSITLIAGMQRKDILVALQALIEVGLSGHAEEDHVALSAELVDHALAAEVSGFKIVGADEEEAVAVRRVGVDGDDRDIRIDSGVDFRLHECSIRDGNEDAIRVSGDGVVQILQLGLCVVVIRAVDLRSHVVLGGGLLEAGNGGLPIRQGEIVGDEVIRLFVRVATTTCQKTERCEGKQPRIS